MGTHAAHGLVKTGRNGAITHFRPTGCTVWDKNHLVAKELQEQLSASQLCCQRNGIIWDVAAVYPKDIQWGSSAPLFFGGAVVDVADSVRQKL